MLWGKIKLNDLVRMVVQLQLIQVLKGRAENNVPNYWDPRSNSSKLTGVGIPKFYELKDLSDKETIFPLVVSAKKSK